MQNPSLFRNRKGFADDFYSWQQGNKHKKREDFLHPLSAANLMVPSTIAVLLELDLVHLFVSVVDDLG